MASRRYPTHSLPDTLERLKKLYESEGINPADREVIAQAIGYSSRNGASDAFIAAMGHYGLIEDSDNQMARISEIGIDILEGDETVSAKAILKAGNNPDLFSELSEQFDSENVSDNNIRYFLIKSGFNTAAAERAVKAYRETLEFVKQQTSILRHSRPHEQEIKPAAVQGRTQPQVISPASRNYNTSNDSELSEWKFPVGENMDVTIVFQGQITDEEIEALIEYLEVARRRLKRQKQNNPNSDN